MPESSQTNDVAEKESLIREELARLLASHQFANSPRMARFLKVIVDAWLAGHSGALKEYAIGCSVFERDSSFDPRLDPVVRTEARRLRQKLALYYSESAPGPIRIGLPKGGYVPSFERVPESVIPRQDRLQGKRPVGRGRQSVYAAAASLLTVLAGLGIWIAVYQRSLVRHHPNEQALAAWQRGRRFVERLDQPIEAMADLKQAVRLDPTFADAYATLSAAYGMAALEGKVPVESGLREAKKLAQQSLVLDPQSAEAYLMLGAAEFFNRDWQRAEELMRRSLALRPNDPFALMTLANIVLQPQGKLPEAIRLMEKAVYLESDNRGYWQLLIQLQTEARDFSRAIGNIDQAILRNGPDDRLQSELPFLYLSMGRLSEASDLAVKVRMTAAQREDWNLEYALARHRKEEARAIASRLLRWQHLTDFQRADLYAILGEEEKMLACLHREEDKHSLAGLLFARFDDHFDPFRSRPGFQRLLARMRMN